MFLSILSLNMLIQKIGKTTSKENIVKSIAILETFYLSGYYHAED